MKSDTGGNESGQGGYLSKPEDEGPEQGESGAEPEGGKSDNEPEESDEELDKEAQEVRIAVRKLYNSFAG